MLSAEIFKANDIRGRVVGDAREWDVAGALAIGRAYVEVAGLQGASCVLGRDMRTTGADLGAAFIEGVTSSGTDVVDVGLVSTDALWYASGALGLPGVMLTASHNPWTDNGMKFCGAHAVPVEPSFLVDLREGSLAGRGTVAPSPGKVVTRDLLNDYGAYLRSLVVLDGLRPLRVVVDAGNGMAGLTTPVVLGPLGLDISGLFMELDGTFPNHTPNPLIPENLLSAQAAVREQGADLGLVFDGDADRCFVINEHGNVVTPSTITGLIALQELQREPGGSIVVNTITSSGVSEEVKAAGGQVVVSPVGHTHVKARMRDAGAIFGGEHSGHYYFRDFWGADTGMLAALHILSMVGRSSLTMSELAATIRSYAGSGEINSTVSDADAAMARFTDRFGGRGTMDRSDGVTVSGANWWVSVRGSNTEPLLRLNVEAPDADDMAALRDEALSVIREGSDSRE